MIVHTKRLMLFIIILPLLTSILFPSVLSSINVQIHTSGTVMSSPVQGKVLWSTRHENGLDDWFVCGWGGQEGSTPPYSDVTVEQVNGKWWAKADIVDPTYASDPHTSYKVRAEVARWGNGDCSSKYVEQYDDLYYGVRILLPNNFAITPDGAHTLYGACLVQLKEGQSWGFMLRYNIDPEYLYVRFRRYDYDTHQYYEDEYGRDGSGLAPVVKGQPFTLVVHIRSTEDGVFEMWLDGTPLLIDHNDYRIGPNDAGIGRISRFIQCGLYVNALFNNPVHMYFTDTVVATELQSVLSFLNG
jgi:hypothetical protein